MTRRKTIAALVCGFLIALSALLFSRLCDGNADTGLEGGRQGLCKSSDVNHDGVPTKTTSASKIKATPSDSVRRDSARPVLSSGFRAMHLHLERITPDASPAVIDGLLASLSKSDGEAFPGLPPSETHALRNDMLNALLRQKALPPGLPPFLVAQSGDATSDPVWRDYCIQHLADCFHRLAAESVMRADIVAALMRVASDPASPLAGTALLGLDSVAPQDAFEPLLTAAIQDESACEPTLVTAIRLAGQLGMSASLPEIRRAAEDARASTPVRLAAIASIGDLGESSDVFFLERLPALDSSRIRLAAEKSRGRLLKRLESETRRDYNRRVP